MSSTPNPGETRWVSSTYSDGQGGQCVQWAPDHAATQGVVPVRDSKDPSGPALAFSVDGWGGFVSAVKRGELSG
ncbi:MULTISPECIES: DUF397 domain-containing protein [unclassified Streptomyces]|uniref:DUF397 domain-containing protein n=1 Tax=unclassified Streptomyces TaxID=2593676 RepID=UPI0022B6CE91|nr:MULTISPECIES: DUF397 domain-containing protein [unclassified Streptomyces]MCZ7415073.1 DUF397 domain-containing protein [Streptomyces sp. WMMC897]MCZ7432016.1 DUF397 domain-containing protein [Streptomyces sp. WMMC1477]